MTAQSHFIRAVDPRQPALRPATCRSRWRPSRSRSFLLCTISLLGASIAALAEPPAGAPATEGLGSADGEQAGTRAVVTDLKRAGNTVTLKFVIYNDSGADLATNAKFTDDGYNGWLSFSGVHLLDGPGKKKYFAVKDGDGNCVCSDGVNGIKAKTSMTFWVKYPAPPDSTQKITVQIPHFVPIDDVLIHLTQPARLNVSQRRLLLPSFNTLIAAFGVIALPVLAQTPVAGQQTKIRDLVYRVGELNFRVDNMGGKVESLQVKETPTEVRIDLSADVLFAFDKADLLPEARQSLTQAAAIIRDKAKGGVRIDGYTDAKGADAYNQRLSERRAAAVESWLKSSGHLTNVSFVSRGFGAKNPVAPNTKPDGSDDPDGRQKNRRVEITITKS